MSNSAAPICNKCSLPAQRWIGQDIPLCEAHYQEWVASRCRRIVVTLDGLATYRERCQRTAKVAGYCTQHYRIRQRREALHE
jgi:hypothetical protein